MVSEYGRPDCEHWIQCRLVRLGESVGAETGASSEQCVRDPRLSPLSRKVRRSHVSYANVDPCLTIQIRPMSGGLVFFFVLDLFLLLGRETK